MGILREERIGGQRLILGDSLKIMEELDKFDHLICDPPYEAITQNAIGGIKRRDGRKETERLRFQAIDQIRAEFVLAAEGIFSKWGLIFCTPEGVSRWADEINNSSIKYKRACVWIKPDSMPQLNGQGPASGAENFIACWGGGFKILLERWR